MPQVSVIILVEETMSYTALNCLYCFVFVCILVLILAYLAYLSSYNKLDGLKQWICFLVFETWSTELVLLDQKQSVSKMTLGETLFLVFFIFWWLSAQHVLVYSYIVCSWFPWLSCFSVLDISLSLSYNGTCLLPQNIKSLSQNFQRNRIFKCRFFSPK